MAQSGGRVAVRLGDMQVDDVRGRQRLARDVAIAQHAFEQAVADGALDVALSHSTR